MMQSTPAALVAEVEQFLYREAFLLEQGRFAEWLELLTDDVVYYLPNCRPDGKLRTDAAIARDGIAALRMRVDRLHDPLNPAVQPPPRTKYFVTNVMAEEEAGGVHVRSSVLLYIVRDGRVRHHPISCEYQLRPAGESWKIAAKTVYLLENGQPLRPLPII